MGRADGLGEVAAGDVLEQVADGTRLDYPLHQLVVTEAGQSDHLLLFGPAVGLSLQGLAVALTVAAALALIAGGLLALAVRTFQRETVLTRWR